MVEPLEPRIPLTPIVTYYRELPTGRAKRLAIANALIEDPQRLAKFRSDFRLTRQTESGLSLVVLFPYRELNENSLIEAAIEHYFFPILAGALVVRVGGRCRAATTGESPTTSN